jgi:uncharacterized lipoprotein YmbA
MNLRWLALLCLFLGLAACGTSQPTRYYLLSPGAAYGDAAGPQRELTIGIGPIILAPYLDRRELVSRSSENELVVAIYDQWGEPLVENFSRVVSEDLGRRLNTDRMVRLPMKRSLRKALTIDYQVTITVNRFEKAPDGRVVLDARWAILDNDKQELQLKRSRYAEVPDGGDYAAQAAAQSAVLARLNAEIAEAILQLQQRAGN